VNDRRPETASQPSSHPSEPPLFDVAPGAHDALADLAAAAGARIEDELHTRRAPQRRWVAYLLLAIAIVTGVSGTSALSASAGFTRPAPLVIVAACYLVCFVALTRALRVIPVSIAYAIWSGVGIALITLIGRFVFGQVLGPGQLVGIALIIAGTVVIQLFSAATATVATTTQEPRK
jgi:small multidrug resistance pump